MEGIVHDQQSHLIQYALRADALTDLTREARGTLRGCTPLGPDSPSPPTLPSLPQLLTSPPLAPPPRWPPSLPRPPPKAAPPPSTSPRLAAMLGVNLAALIVCVTCSTVTCTALLGVGPWLRRRKRRGWSRVACVSHEEGSKATQWPNGAHEDEDAAAHEGGVLGHLVAHQKVRPTKNSRSADSESPQRPNPWKTTNHDTASNGFLGSTGPPMVAAAPDLERDDGQSPRCELNKQYD